MVTTSRRAPLLPSKVWIGSHEVKIHRVPDLDPKLDPLPDPEDTDPARLRGMSELSDPPIIYINEALNPTQMLEVVMHELCHVINWAAKIDDGAEEEAVAEAHGTGWTQLFLHNPRFHRWFDAQVVQIRKDQKNA